MTGQLTLAAMALRRGPSSVAEDAPTDPSIPEGLPTPSYLPSLNPEAGVGLGWTAIELMLAGERLCDANQNGNEGFSRLLAEAVASVQEKVSPEELKRADPEWRLTCWQQLRAARQAGLFHPWSPADANRGTGVPESQALARSADAAERSSWYCLRPLLEMRGRGGEVFCLTVIGWFVRRGSASNSEPGGPAPADWDGALEQVARLLTAHAASVDEALRTACGEPQEGTAPPVIDTMAATLYFQRGLASIQAGDYERAVVSFSTAIRHNPTMEQAYVQRGDAQRTLGAYDGAIADYTAARRLNPANPRTLINRGQTYRMLGRIQLALADYDVALRLDPASVVALNHRGTARAEVGDHDAAIADFSRAIEIDRDNPFTYQNRAQSNASIENLDAAIADYSQVLRLNPIFTLAHIRRADAYRQLDKLDQAIADYTEALRLDPQQLHAYVNRGESYQSQGQAGRALSDFEAALKLGGTTAQVYLNRGIANRNNGAAEAALTDFDAALQLEPDNHLVFLHRALAFKELLEFDRATADMDEVVRRRPDWADAYFHRGTLRIKTREAEAAVADLTAAIVLDGGNAQAYVARGLAHALAGQLDLVVADCTRAVELDESLLRAYKTRGTAYYRKGDFESALADFELILTSQPEDTEALFNRGLVHARLGDHEAAVAGLTRALELVSASPRILAARATSYRVLERDDEALADYAEALQYDKHYGPAYCNQRAFMHMKRGDRNLALADCELSLLLDPDNRNAQLLRDQVTKSIPVEVVRRSIPASLEPTDDTASSTHLVPIRPRKPLKSAASSPSIEFETSGTGTIRAVKLATKKPAPAKPAPAKPVGPPSESKDETAPESAERTDTASTPTDPTEEELIVKPEDSAEYEREQAELKKKMEQEAALIKARVERQRQEEEEKQRKAIAERHAERRHRRKAQADDDDGSSPWVRRGAAAAAVLILGYFIAPLAWDYVKARSIPQDEEVELVAAAKVTAVDLCKKYQSDAADAQTQFGDKILEITGTIKDIKGGPDNSTLILLMDQKGDGRVSCKLPQPKSLTQGTMLSRLDRQQTVVLKGKCTGKDGNTINLDGVQLVTVRER